MQPRGGIPGAQQFEIPHVSVRTMTRSATMAASVAMRRYTVRAVPSICRTVPGTLSTWTADMVHWGHPNDAKTRSVAAPATVSFTNEICTAVFFASSIIPEIEFLYTRCG